MSYKKRWIAPPPEIVQAECAACGWKGTPVPPALAENQYNRHIETRHGGGLDCIFCHLRMPDFNILAHHVKTMCDKAPAKCPHCGLNLLSDKVLDWHIRSECEQASTQEKKQWHVAKHKHHTNHPQGTRRVANTKANLKALANLPR